MSTLDNSAIAIIGMSGRFPGAPNLDAFWQNLRDGVESISAFSDEDLAAAGVAPAMLRDPSYVKAAPVLEGIDRFDAAFFGINPREAEIMDPQHRLLMECAWEALEHAGYDPLTYPGAIGLYAGEAPNSYWLFTLYLHRNVLSTAGAHHVLIGSEKDHLTTRVSYKLNLRGPSLTVQTSCSTALVAVHLACQALLNGDCDLALAGGVSVNLLQHLGYFYEQGGIVSPDGHCRAFGAEAAGTVFGSGVGLVVLKPLGDALADGDTIHAVIKGSAINNDGVRKIGYTAPSVEGQAAAIGEALAVARVDPATIGYVETHGTGTPLGDPIEVAALTQVFGVDVHNQRCAIGSVKTNIGHLNAAAGVAGLIKTVLALKHGQIPPSLHAERPSPQIDFAGSPFYLNTRLSAWPEGPEPRRAGVSSFGFGGTNAHAVVEAAPPLAHSGPSRPWQLLPLSARSTAALEQQATNLAAYLRAHPELSLADVAYTLQVGRHAFACRRALICRDRDEAMQALEASDPAGLLTQTAGERAVVFVFSGEETGQAKMSRELYEVELLFREQIDRCCELLRPHLGLDLRDVIFDDRRPRDKETRRQGDKETGRRGDGETGRRGDGETGEREHYPNLQSPISSLQSPDEHEQAQSKIDETWLTQPALFTVEYALAQLWMSWGVQPDALIGHGTGEYVAACLAGVLTLEDALGLVAARGRLMHQLPAGAMLAVALGEQALRPLLGEQLDLAAVDGPQRCVVSGPLEAIACLEADLAAMEIAFRRLNAARAFHSAMVDPILEPLAGHIRALRLQPPRIPSIASLTGTWIAAEEATSPAYWVRQARQTVRFGQGLQEIARDPRHILLEIGRGHVLDMPEQPDVLDGQDPLACPREPLLGVQTLVAALGRLWRAGAAVDWAGFAAGEQRRRVPLPTYPFERRRYWLEPSPELLKLGHMPMELAEDAATPAAPAPPPRPLQPRPSLLVTYVAPQDALEEQVVAIWQDLLGTEPIGIYDSFFELGGHSLLAPQLLTQVRKSFGVDLALQHLFVDPTVVNMAQIIRQMRDQRADAGDIAALRPGPAADEPETADLDALSDGQVDQLLHSLLEARKVLE